MAGRALVFFVCISCVAFSARGEAWRHLGGGLELAEFPAAKASFLGDSKITVLRIDPKLARLVLLSSLYTLEPAMTARAWSAKHKLRAVINAGMFGPDALPVGLARVDGVDINPKLGSQNSIFVFGADKASLPAAQLLDRRCAEVSPTLGLYKNLLQSLRVIDCHGKITRARPVRSTAARGSSRRLRGRS